MKRLSITILSVLTLGFIPSAMAAGSTNPSVNIDEGMLSAFQELVVVNPGLERIKYQSNTEFSISSKDLKRTKKAAVGPDGLLITPVKGKVGSHRTVAVMSASYDTLLSGPVDINNVFSVSVVVRKDKPKFLETLTAARLTGSTALVSLAGVTLQEAKGQFGGQVRVTVINPVTGQVTYTGTYTHSATMGYLDVRSSAIVDADGDGSDDLVIQYRSPISKHIDHVSILVISLSTGNAINSYFENDTH
ncbi:hypothetical protein D8Y20_02880 [Mariprofundus sp. EBB-1]|uniref:hypothetical protein n=1 Tax=Mariprofundus sp. EBB-1 TaxID=2650971 RepID=UPI000EF26E50|nr:hypothetical protein [Mariprofundus sp. EBB-1]RLL54740.1 hypothetical protein D8Y20_02880 [Mariprofundus sp. EBB-1]